MHAAIAAAMTEICVFARECPMPDKQPRMGSCHLNLQMGTSLKPQLKQQQKLQAPSRERAGQMSERGIKSIRCPAKACCSTSTHDQLLIPQPCMKQQGTEGCSPCEKADSNVAESLLRFKEARDCSRGPAVSGSTVS